MYSVFLLSFIYIIITFLWRSFLPLTTIVGNKLINFTSKNIFFHNHNIYVYIVIENFTSLGIFKTQISNVIFFRNLLVELSAFQRKRIIPLYFKGLIIIHLNQVNKCFKSENYNHLITTSRIIVWIVNYFIMLDFF
jgi:hypothetical protein